MDVHGVDGSRFYVLYWTTTMVLLSRLVGYGWATAGESDWEVAGSSWTGDSGPLGWAGLAGLQYLWLLEDNKKTTCSARWTVVIVMMRVYKFKFYSENSEM